VIELLSEQHITGSARYCNVFHCSRCYKRYYLPWMLKRHAEKCMPSFGNIVFEQNDLSIAYVNVDSSPLERLICERISRISQVESGWDFPLLHKNNWLNTDIRSHAFLLLKDRSIISYLAIRDRKLLHNKELKDDRILSDFFTIHSYRQKGYAKILLLNALEFLGEPFESLVFLTPFTDKGYNFVSAISKTLGVPMISTCH